MIYLERLKGFWNRFVDGFETGSYGVAITILGVLDTSNVFELKDYLPEKFGQVFIALGVITIGLRFFVALPWFKKFR